MATVRCFWHGFIHRGTTFIYVQNSRPPYSSPFAKCLKGATHNQPFHLCWCSVYWLPYITDKFTSCVVPGLSKWLFHYSGELVIAHRVSTVNVPESPIAIDARGPWQQQRCVFVHCHEKWWDSVPPSDVVFSWVHAITISSPKWKNQCKGPGTTQAINSSVL